MKDFTPCEHGSHPMGCIQCQLAVQPPATPQEPICGTCGKPASDGDTYVQCGPCHWASTPSPEGQTTWHDRGVQPPATPQEPESLTLQACVECGDPIGWDASPDPTCCLCGDARRRDAERTVASLAAMLGWGNVPPRDVLERSVAALKARASASPQEGRGRYYGQPLNVAVEGERLVIAVGVQTLCHATAFAAWANPFDEAADDYIRTFAIADAPQFVKDVVCAMLAEREDGSTPLSDFLDRMAQAAIEEGSLGLHEDEQHITHGTFAPCEAWSVPAREPHP